MTSGPDCTVGLPKPTMSVPTKLLLRPLGVSGSPRCLLQASGLFEITCFNLKIHGNSTLYFWPHFKVTLVC